MDTLMVLDKEDSVVTPTFSYIDTRDMVVHGPFCRDCMNQKTPELSKISCEKLIIQFHKIEGTESLKLCKCLVQTSATKRCFLSVHVFHTSEELQPLPCSTLSCSSNKNVKWSQKNSNKAEDFESNKTDADDKMNTIPEKLLSSIDGTPDQKEPRLESLALDKMEPVFRKDPFSNAASSQHLPFFHMGIAVKKQVYVTEEYSLTKFEQIRNSDAFTNFVIILGQRFPYIGNKLARNPRCPIRCETCETGFYTWRGVVKHTLTRDHLIRMNNWGHVFHAKDFELFCSIFEEACLMFLNDKITVIEESKKIVAGPIETTEIATENETLPKLPEKMVICPKILSPTDWNKKSARSDLPFFRGTHNASLKIPANNLTSFLAEPRKVVSSLRSDVLDAILQSEYNVPGNPTCPACRTKVAVSEWIKHLISQEHIDKLASRGRYVSPWDLSCLTRILKGCEKKTAQLTNEAQKRTSG